MIKPKLKLQLRPLGEVCYDFLAIPAISNALDDAGIQQSDVGCVLFVSHSPFHFPPVHPDTPHASE